MRRAAFLAATLAILAGAPGRARASLIFYGTRASFDAANPGLPIETFSAANVAAGQFTSVASPISSTTNDGVFAPGDILPGLTVGSSSGTLIVLGDGFVTGTTKSVGSNSAVSNVVLSFAPGATAVGTDVFAAAVPGPTIAETFEINVFGPSGLLGFTTVSETGGNIAFFGVSSDVPITSITLHDQRNNASTFVDNIAFGAVPEPGSLGLTALGGMVLLGCGITRRRGRAARG